MADQSSIVSRLTVMMEKATLALIILLTFTAIILEVVAIIEQRQVAIADILLLFLYAEVISMVAVYYVKAQSAFVYPILIAITALSRLIVLQGKDMDPQSIVFEAGAILILAVAILLVRSTDLRTLLGHNRTRKEDVEYQETATDRMTR